MPVIGKKNKKCHQKLYKVQGNKQKGRIHGLAFVLSGEKLLNSMLGRRHTKVHSLLFMFYTFINHISEELPFNVFEMPKDTLKLFPLAFGWQNGIYNTKNFQRHSKILSQLLSKTLATLNKGKRKLLNPSSPSIQLFSSTQF